MKKVAMIAGRPRFYKPAKVKAAENTLWAILQPHAPAEPFCGPLTLVLTMGFPWRKGEKKSRIKHFASYPIETRPDLDNLFKAIADVMTGLRYWNDDSQLSSLCLHKHYTDTPGLTINLTHSLATARDGQISSAL
jgi:Holliday junction resolvase RusA-like endonuclease